MHRRSFLKQSTQAIVGLAFLPHLSTSRFMTFATDSLPAGFQTPPNTARPWTYWMWMNGHITKAGITADLEAMKRMGIGGVINFNAATGIPRGPVSFADETWLELFSHATRECDRLGIIMTMHNAPGYSGAGGPWITPELSMQQLVWTEILVSGSENGPIPLPKPTAKHNYYRDAFVVAYPSLAVEKALMKDKLVRVIANGKEVDKNVLTDKNTGTKIRLDFPNGTTPPSDPRTTDYAIAGDTTLTGASRASTNPISLVLEFAEPFEARAISILRRPEVPHDLFDGPRDHPPLIYLESSMDGVTYSRIGAIHSPELRHMDTPSALSFESVTAKFYRLLLTGPSWICDVELYNGPRLGGWPGKTNYTHGEFTGNTPTLSNELLIDPTSVIDLSDKLNQDGTLHWDRPVGSWTILRIGHTTTGEETFAHPEGGNGLQLDKFRKEALDFHFTHFLDKVIERVKPMFGKSFKGFTVDSWEAGKQNWSIGFPEEFQKRRGYDLASWMPALTGRIVGSVDVTERFLWDVRRTGADLLSENFFAHFQRRCHQLGLEFQAEPYGDGNLDSMQIAEYLDVPMAEFWSRYMYGSDGTSKQAASMAHAYGRPVAAAEAFTGMPLTSKWTDYPYSLKAEGDWFYTLGINRLVFHVFVHQPYTTGLPGMTMGPFGTHFDRNSTWTQQASGWIHYLTRTQYLLQQGLPVVDVCYFKGDDLTSDMPDVYRIIPKGYVGDVIGREALLKRVTVHEGDIVLPDGMRYRIMMMPFLGSLTSQSARKLKELVTAGMWLLVSSKPDDTFGASEEDKATTQKIVTELWGNLDGQSIQERAVGNGKIFWGKPLETILQQREIQPDFEYSAKNQDATIHYIHKKLPKNTELYFVSNQRRRKEMLICSFRVNGKLPELWDAETGRIHRAALYQVVNGRTQVALELEPAGAIFVVFRAQAAEPVLQAVSFQGAELISLKPFAPAKTNPFADVQNNFTITAWVKPDSYAHSGRSMLFHAPQGELAYGIGHVACALGAGQNGVRVYERGGGPAREILNVTQSLEGWTHLALLYKNGHPSLYLNGKLAGSYTGSGQVVHPGLATPATDEQFSSYFEGNYTPIQLHRETLSIDQINQEMVKGLPMPELPTALTVSQSLDGTLKAIVWQDGQYVLEGPRTQRLVIKNSCRTKVVSGSWVVRFPVNLGAPPEIILPRLTSLHKHATVGVRHFSGTATYYKSITIPRASLGSGKKLFLDLGRVEVIARVMVNGKEADLLWKEPFRVDITNLAKAGANTLEIQVTNLWPNRLIGDEQLPVENQYSADRFIGKLPDWYVQNKPKSGQRISFSTWHNIDKDDPLLESGLLGPVRLLTAVERSL